MINTNVKTAITYPERTAAVEHARLFYLDYLRAGLAILVVIHHIALVYGAAVEGFYYLEPPFTDPIAYLALMVFVLINQGWFMGAFFLLSGYFTPGSYDRKGAENFLRSRFIRLGIPLLLFFFVLNPISRVGWWLMPSSLTGISTPLTWSAYPRLVGIGPLWFVAMLLIFSIGYAAWRILTAQRISPASSESSAPGLLGIGVFILVLAVASYLVRILIPLGKSIYEFPTLSYFPQYLGFYVIGIVAARKNWLSKLSTSTGVVGFIAALLALVVLFPLAFSGQLFSLQLTPAVDNAMGNGHWQSAVYALWDSTFAVGLTLGFIVLMRGFMNGRAKFGMFLSKNSYAVYIIHIPIVVYIAYLIRGIQLPTLQKFGLASLIIIPICFIAAYLVRRLPLAKKIL